MGHFEERREYDRQKVIIPCTIFIENGKEILGEIQDISETGAKIFVDVSDRDNFLTGMTVQIAFLDTFQLGRQTDDYIISCDIKIVRINSANNKILLGCKTRSAVYEDYVRHKKFSIYHQIVEKYDDKNAGV